MRDEPECHMVELNQRQTSSLRAPHWARAAPARGRHARWRLLWLVDREHAWQATYTRSTPQQRAPSPVSTRPITVSELGSSTTLTQAITRLKSQQVWLFPSQV